MSGSLTKALLPPAAVTGTAASESSVAAGGDSSDAHAAAAEPPAPAAASETNLFREIDVDGPDVLSSDLLGEARVVKKGSITGTGKDRLDVEDALDRIGGVSWFQLVHFCACGVFWFAQPGVLFSIFANAPCRGGGAVCTTPDGGADGRGNCCSEWEAASVAAGDGGCAVPVDEPDGVGICSFAGGGTEPDGTQPFWSDCRSVSCQYNLGSESSVGVFRELFDSVRKSQPRAQTEAAVRAFFWNDCGVM